MSDGLLCNRQGCRNYAVYEVVLLMRVTKNGVAAEGLTGLHVCEEHKDVTLADIVPDDRSMKYIAMHFTQAGYAAPKREFSNVKLVKLLPPIM